MSENNVSPFNSSLSSENLLHTMIKGIQTSISENKQATDTKLDRISAEVREVKSTVDRLGIDHLEKDLGRVEEKCESLSKRLDPLEKYHNKILGGIALVGFIVAMVLGLKELIF